LINHVHWTVETVFAPHPWEFLAVEYSTTLTLDEAVHSLLLV